MKVPNPEALRNGPPRIGGGGGAVLAALLLATALLAGCARHATDRPPADNRLRDSLYSSPQTFDPALCQSVPNSQMLQQIFEGLVQYDSHNRLVPCLAQSWEVSNGGKTYTFHLRSGVKFQNGQPLTAEDVAYSLSRALDPKLASPVAAEYLKDIVGSQEVLDGQSLRLSGVRVADPQTVAITIDKPAAYWINTLTYCVAWVVCKSAVAPLGDDP